MDGIIRGVWTMDGIIGAVWYHGADTGPPKSCLTMVARSDGRTVSGSIPCARSSSRSLSDVVKSFARLACTHSSSFAFTSGLCAESGGAAGIGAAGIGAAGIAIGAPYPQSYAFGGGAAIRGGGAVAAARSDGRTVSGSIPFARSSSRSLSDVVKSLARFACTHRSSISAVSSGSSRFILEVSYSPRWLGYPSVKITARDRFGPLIWKRARLRWHPPTPPPRSPG